MMEIECYKQLRIIHTVSMAMIEETGGDKRKKQLNNTSNHYGLTYKFTKLRVYWYNIKQQHKDGVRHLNQNEAIGF